MFFTSDPVKVFDKQTNIWMESYNILTQKILLKKQPNVEAQEDTVSSTEEIIWYGMANDFLKNTKLTKTFNSTKSRFLIFLCVFFGHAVNKENYCCQNHCATKLTLEAI